MRPFFLIDSLFANTWTFLDNYSKLQNMEKTQNCALLACAAALLLHTGCVPIPISTEPSSIVETPKYDEQYASFLKSTKVTHLHRRFTKAMQKGSNGIEIVDSRKICQEVLPKHDPDADILLEELLMADVRNRILSQGIRFLVVLSPLRTLRIGTTHIRMTNLASTLIDIKENTILDSFAVTASGKDWGIPLPIIMPYARPDTRQGAIDTMAERIAEIISEKMEGKPTRIMFVEKVPGYETVNRPGLVLHEELREEKSHAWKQLHLYYQFISQDTVNAHYWLCRSADQGYPPARNRIGYLYENCEEGLPCSRIRALYWYRLATRYQHHWGADAERLIKSSTPAELAEVERLIESWEPGQCERDLISGNPD
jgi:hypothetical protein